MRDQIKPKRKEGAKPRRAATIPEHRPGWPRPTTEREAEIDITWGLSDPVTDGGYLGTPNKASGGSCIPELAVANDPTKLGDETHHTSAASK